MPHLWWAAAAAAAFYVGVVATGATGGIRAAKILPGLLLAGLLAPTHPLAAGGMALSALGDGFLLDKDRFLLHGMAAFLLGHLLFVPAFLDASGRTPSGALITGLLGVAFALVWYLRPQKPVFKLAVPIYAVVLCAMVAAATTLGPIGATGGLLFLLSDALLSIRLFRRTFPGNEVIVMLTYHGALLVLAVAVGTS